MLSYLRQLQTERDSLTQAATNLTETAATESRDVTDTERASIASMAQRCATIDDQLRTFAAQLESQRAYADLRARFATDDETPPERTREVERRAPEAQTWGELFIGSAEFRSYDGYGRCTPVHVPGPFQTRAPIDTITGIGGFPAVPYTATVPQPSFTTPLLDAVGHITTNSQLIQWLADDGVYPPAAVVPEGQAKPEADITTAFLTGTLKTYAHWKGITRQALANLPMIQSIVESQLRGGIFAKLEADIATALANAALGGVTYDPAAPGGPGMLGGIREGIATAQLQGFPNANAVALNPADYASLDLAVYQGTNAGPATQSAFWGLKPVPSSGVPVGTAYVGDLKAGVTVFDEGQASVYMTDSHSDFFVKNVLVILAEVMALAMVTQGAALVRVTPVVAGP